MIEERIVFTGGRNVDDDPRVLPKGDFIKLNNGILHNPKNGQRGIIQPFLGLTDRTNSSLPAGENNVIGWCVAHERDGFIQFMHNDLGNHGIYLYNVITETWVEILQDTNLNFQRHSLIDAKVIGNRLYWTDGWFQSYTRVNLSSNPLHNPPRSINIDTAIAGGYNSIDWQTLDAIKWPPSFAPTTQRLTDSSVKSNFLTRGMFQFNYLYIYEDDQKSRFSPTSKIDVHPKGEAKSGSVVFDDKYNYIEVTLNSGPDTVKKIQVAVRKGNTSEYVIFKEIDKAAEGVGDGITFTVRYYGKEHGTPVPLGFANYDALPQIAGAQEYTTDNNLVYGQITEGFDQVVPDITITKVLNEVDYYHDQFITHPTPSGGTLTFTLDDNKQPGENYITEGSSWTATIYVSGVGNTFTWVADQDYTNNATGARDAIVTYLNGLSFGWTIANVGSDGFSIATVTSITGENIDFFFPRYSGLKTGAWHQVGIQYYDRARRDGTVYFIPAGRIYVPHPSEEDTSAFTDPNAPYYVTLEVTISHQAPDWATDYQIMLRTSESIQNFQWRSIKTLNYAELEEPIGGSLINPERYRLDLEDYFAQTHKGATIHHEIKVGDRARFVRKFRDSTTPLNNGDYVDEVEEFEVLSYDPVGGADGGESIEIARIGYFESVGVSSLIRTGAVLEIYTPRETSENSPWYEVGAAGLIDDEHYTTRHHEGDVQDQTGDLATPAIQSIGSGDVWLRGRVMGSDYAAPLSFVFFVEDPHYSDYYISDNWDRGRISFEVKTAKREELRALRHSGVFQDSTQINNLNRFEPEDILMLRYEDGPVTNLNQVGFVLKALQHHRNTSIYVGRQTITQPDKTEDQILTSQTFGAVNPSEDNFGCQMRGAVAIHDRVMYYVDCFNGTIIRDTASGQTEITRGKYKMESLWGPYLREMYIEGIDGIADGDMVHIGVNREMGQIHFQIEPIGGVASAIHEVFNYEIDRWVQSYDSAALQGFSWFGDFFYWNAEQGVTWQGNLGNPLQSATGVKLRLYVDFVANENRHLKKIYQNLRYQSTGEAWKADTIDILGPETVDANNPMQSSIPKENFEFLEGVYNSPFLMDHYTPGIYDSGDAAATKLRALYQGRELRGNAAVIRLIYENWKITGDLDVITVQSIPSEIIP